MAYALGNKCAKNLCKRTVLGQLIIENVVTCFLDTLYCKTVAAITYLVHCKQDKLSRCIINGRKDIA